MMLMELKPPQLDTGGLSCKFCRFWLKYSPEQCELNELANNNWGKCSNQSVNLQAQLGFETGRFTDMVDIKKIGCITVVSTYNNYSCPNYKRILPVGEDPKGKQK